MRYRHAFEVRHPSYFTDEFADLLREHDIGFIVADTAGKFPYAETVTSRFVYVRLHGSRQLYVSGYTDDELATWAGRESSGGEGMGWTSTSISTTMPRCMRLSTRYG